MSAALGFAFACAGPWAAHVYVGAAVNRAVEQLNSADPAEIERASRTLQYFRFLPSSQFDNVVWTYFREENPARRDTLACAYQRITGGDIEERLLILRD